MSETEIYDRLNELSSYFSFGRVLGYIAFFETIGIESQLKHGQDANKDRMLSSELNFLAGLWIQNVVLDKTWDITLDDDFTREVTAVPFRNLPVRIGSAYSNRLTLSREQSC